MIVDWRRLLPRLGVAWTDRGANHAKGNVNIKCPFCGPQDPSYHMSVSEEKPAYYCYRNTQHRGQNLFVLLHKLGASPREADKLLAEFGSKHLRLTLREPPPPPQLDLIERAWARFQPAADNPRMLSYLKGRGFPSPAVTCSTYGLRSASEGRWASRLLLPFKNLDGKIYTWVGRDITGRLDPKYLMYEERLPGSFYLPRAARRVLLVVEGPIDALKIAAATETEDLTPVSLAGKGLNDSKILRLGELSENCSKILMAVDYDVSLAERLAMQSTLESNLGLPVKRLSMPGGYKDPGEMPLGEIRSWLSPHF